MIWIVPLLVALLLWFRLKFWNRQPIRHYLTLYKKGILSDHPLDNKFVVPQVLFYDVTELTKELENELYDYVKEKQTSYHKKSHFMGFLKKGYISIYYENKSIRGCLTSREVEFTFNKETVDAYSTDFLYADTSYVLKCLIQSHEYKKHTVAYPTSIFTSISKIKWVMPITTYDIKWAYTNSFQKYIFPVKTRFVKATPSSLNEIFSFFKTPFVCQMTPTFYTLSSLIESQNISIYSIYNPYLVAILFFKNTYELEHDLSIVDWIGTIIKEDIQLQEVISTIIHGIRNTFKIVRIHQLSHTPPYTTHYKTTQCRKYAYNYGIYSLPPSQCFFL
jgi:hypothetical protein|uniref:Uncharacterized protein n=1 Tax=viral metagenome TaxID=1070528 RepID=A0A6C0B9G2_9ZZZZ